MSRRPCQRSVTRRAPQGSRGAALISAMITVTLVAALASAALWQQWRQVDIESAERSRAQTAWLLTGALDFSRLILREDKGPADHLAEPWALGLQESKLSSFLAQDKQVREGDPEVFLSGAITDAQSRLNVRNLIDNGQTSPNGRASFAKLFTLLGLPLNELSTLQQQLLQAQKAAAPASNALAPTGANAASAASAANANSAPLMPQQTAQLVWLGLSARTVELLMPYVCVLPEATPLNLNTAGPEVIYASLPGLDLAAAQQFVRQRANKPPLETLEAAGKVLGLLVNQKEYDFKSKYFFIRGRMRLEDTVQEDHLLVERNGQKVSILWRERAVRHLPLTP
jgi:general secretion pathway protein K